MPKCPLCKGARTIYYPPMGKEVRCHCCNGTGKVAEIERKCSSCNGTGHTGRIAPGINNTELEKCFVCDGTGKIIITDN